MTHLTATVAQKKWLQIIANLARDHEPVTIVADAGDAAVLLSMDD